MNPDNDDLYKPTGVATAVAEPPPAASAPAPAPTAAPPAGGGSVTWTASEYIHHERGASWYALLLVGTAVLAAGIYFLTKDYFATGAIAVVGILVGVFAGRKPRQITYQLTSSGLKIGEKLYGYGLFKSFSIIRGSEASSVSLMPLKKFMPPVDAFFGAADEEKIIDLIGQHLPYEERQQAGIDRLSHKLRF